MHCAADCTGLICRLYRPDLTRIQLQSLISWAQGPFGNMAMGNYPYPSTYLMHGDSFLPAWPMREACKVYLRIPAVNSLSNLCRSSSSFAC